ncbi:hypothetical protein CEP48_01780 [Mergibacter septicus]|uniref:Uncharacterized protein n=2 Tax=Mergibacter septicus TaxID=221402 RepID=A0A8E3SCP0_9PAST|nr:hypothetical protein CEP47_01780 [Mergibacter septicus]QDJ14226.1 hypothetical protein CEP48_01780 [Mergibacter septicus]
MDRVRLMPQSKNQLIAQLLLQVKTFTQKLGLSDSQLSQPIELECQATYFTENGLTLAEYLQQITSSIYQLEQIEDLEFLSFQTERIYTQFRILYDAIHSRQALYVNHHKKKSKPSNKDKFSIHQLPPKQRLPLYYDALQALNQKIYHLEDLAFQAQNLADKEHYQQQITITLQRKQRCQDAIDNLEEFLAFQQQQAKVSK